MRKFVMITLILAMSVPMWCQQPTASTPASRAEVMKLLEIMRVNSQMTLMLKNMTVAFQTGAREAFLRKKPNASEAQVAALDEMMGSLLQDFKVDELIAEIIPVYQRNLSSEEVNALGSFYNSPTGQKILDKMPKLSQESMQVGMDYGKSKMEAAMARMEVLSKELVKAGEQPKEKK